MKKEVVHNLVIISTLIVAIGFIFMNSSINFTGNVVLEGYNEESCLTAGYTWENITEENCTSIEGCVLCEPDCVSEYSEVLCEEGCVTDYTEILCLENCQDSCGENESECVLCEPDCVSEYSEVLCEDGCVTDYTEILCLENCQETCEECEDVVVAGQCVGDICDSNHLSLCLNESSCTSFNGYWYDNVCNVNQQCIPDCADSDCGGDGCGGSCGSCNSDETCSAGICEKDKNEEDDNGGSDPSFSSSGSISSSVIKESVKICAPEWSCGDWSECINGTQTRVCEDLKNCGSEEGKPEIFQICKIPENCFDGILNQNEKGIDCGGICEQKCSIFTIIGSVVNGPIESSKEFFNENKTMSFISLGVFVLLIGVIFSLKIFLHSKKKSTNEKGNKMSDEEIAKRIGDVTNI
jgi:hypothetical protein